MGVDVVMWAVTEEEIDDGLLHQLNERAKDAFSDFFARPPFCRFDDMDYLGPDDLAYAGISRDATVLFVNTLSRYYGPGYERGVFPTIYMVAEWIERNVPGASVWYGGDSTLAPCRWTEDRKKEYLDHFMEHGYPYRRYWSST